MKNLFEPGTVQEVMTRIEQLQPFSQRQWGKMDVAQMMAHCSAALEMASGKVVAKRTLLGRIVGPRVRHLLTDDSPFPRNRPTAKELKVGTCDFTEQRERLKQCVREFQRGRRITMYETSSPILWQDHASGMEHRHVQTPGSSPEAIWSVTPHLLSLLMVSLMLSLSGQRIRPRGCRR